MIGLAARARKLVSGEEMTVQAIRSGNAQVALLDAGAGPNTTKSVTDACRYYGIALAVLQPGELGHAIGREGRMAAAVTDKGMAKRIRDLTQCGIPGDGKPD